MYGSTVDSMRAVRYSFQGFSLFRLSFASSKYTLKVRDKICSKGIFTFLCHFRSGYKNEILCISGVLILD